MTAERPEALDPEGLTRHLPRHIAVLGLISLLTAMSSAMVYGLLPVFLVKSLGATTASGGNPGGPGDRHFSFRHQGASAEEVFPAAAFAATKRVRAFYRRLLVGDRGCKPAVAGAVQLRVSDLEGAQHRHRRSICADHAGPGARRLCCRGLSVRCSRRSYRSPAATGD